MTMAMMSALVSKICESCN